MRVPISKDANLAMHIISTSQSMEAVLPNKVTTEASVYQVEIPSIQSEGEVEMKSVRKVKGDAQVAAVFKTIFTMFAPMYG